MGGEEVLWRGKPTVLAFYDMLAGGAFIMLVGGVSARLSPFKPLAYLGLLGVAVGGVVVALAFMLSRAYTYMVYVDRLRREYRFVASSVEEVPVEAVTNTIVLQDVVGRIFNFGTVRIDTAGTPYPGMIFKGVKNPEEPYRVISRLLRERGKASEPTHPSRRSSTEGSL